MLIVGEPGTGREMVARAIHAHGPRHQQPFVKLLCGDTSTSALDAVLAAGSHEGGTVYFEDLCELSAEMQKRVESAHDAQVRFIASAQPRVDDVIEKGLLRRSLVATLGVVRIELPPLRQRSQDVPLLAVHFLKDACVRNDVPPKTFSRSALMLLSSLPWRGNAVEGSGLQVAGSREVRGWFSIGGPAPRVLRPRPWPVARDEARRTPPVARDEARRTSPVARGA